MVGLLIDAATHHIEERHKVMLIPNHEIEGRTVCEKQRYALPRVELINLRFYIFCPLRRVLLSGLVEPRVHCRVRFFLKGDPLVVNFV